MGLFKRRRFVSVIGRKSAVPAGLFMKCMGCNQAVLRAEVEENLNVCTICGYHYRLSARERIEQLVDADTFEETHGNVETTDPLEFSVGEETYLEKIDQYKQKTALSEALVTGVAAIENTRTVLGVMDFGFCGASMGSVVGEKFCRAAENAVAENLPMVIVCCSGGARMQEGILALMQMAKTADAVRAMNEAGVPYISVVTDPTSGGVWASFASLGDIILAEPGAYVGFAGTRVIESALNVELPEGFQRSEYQFDNGFVDRVVKRKALRTTLGKLLRYLAPDPGAGPACD